MGSQERPEDVPTGELPRAVTLVADRHLVGRVAPGTRVTVTGIYSICQVGVHSTAQQGARCAEVWRHQCQGISMPGRGGARGWLLTATCSGDRVVASCRVRQGRSAA